VYHPQTNSQIEQINQEVEAFLRHYVNYQQDNWTEWLSVVEFQYNNKKHMAIEHTSFKLNFGRHLWKGNLIIRIELPKLFPKIITKELEQSKNINKYSKRSYEETV